MTLACVGKCNTRYWQAEALYKQALAKWEEGQARLLDAGFPVPDPPQRHSIRPVPGEPVWCAGEDSCTVKIRVMFGELDDLAAKLSRLPPGVRPAVNLRRQQIKVKSSPAPRSPSAAVDTLTELQAWLLHYERQYRRLHRWGDPPKRGSLAAARTSAIAWLGDHLDGLLVTRLAEPFGVELFDIYGELQAATHDDVVEHFVPTPCPKPPRGCGRFTLWQKPGDENIHCRNPNCNRVLTREELEDKPTQLSRHK